MSQLMPEIQPLGRSQASTQPKANKASSARAVVIELEGVCNASVPGGGMDPRRVPGLSRTGLLRRRSQLRNATAFVC